MHITLMAQSIFSSSTTTRGIAETTVAVSVAVLAQCVIVRQKDACPTLDG